MSDQIDLDQYYTAKEAAGVLSIRSGKRIDAAYIRSLARYGKLHPKQINTRLNLYPKYEIDNYIVEERGAKAASAAKAKSTREKKRHLRGSVAREGKTPGMTTEEKTASLVA